MLGLKRLLTIVWTLLALVAAMDVILLMIVYRQGESRQVEAQQRLLAGVCADLERRMTFLPAGAAPDEAGLRYVLTLALYDAPGVEGSFWSPSRGFYAYAFPTYAGSGPKTDVPTAESRWLAELSRRASQGGTIVEDVQRGGREAVIAEACPMPVSADAGTVAWFMTRVHTGGRADLDNLVWAAAATLAVVVAIGGWLLFIGLQLRRRFGRVQQTLDSHLAGDPLRVELAGVPELDQVIHALNRASARLDESQRREAALAQEVGRQERFAILGKLAASVAHEIRNPVGAMRLKAENALAAPDDRAQSALSAIVGLCGRLERLVDELMAFTQPIAIAARSVDLKAWTKDRIDGFRDDAEHRGIALEVEAQGEGRFDAEQIGRVLDNLLRNALEQAPRGGAVRVAAVSGDDGVEIVVEDDGPGVDPALADRIFEPFVTSRPRGGGLGLAQSREIVQAHGGELILESSESGARFKVRIPWP